MSCSDGSAHCSLSTQFSFTDTAEMAIRRHRAKKFQATGYNEVLLCHVSCLSWKQLLQMKHDYSIKCISIYINSIFIVIQCILIIYNMHRSYYTTIYIYTLYTLYISMRVCACAASTFNYLMILLLFRSGSLICCRHLRLVPRPPGVPTSSLS